MKPPEEVRQELVRQSLARAFEDLNVARLLIDNRAPWHAAVAFHSQQAAEKFLEALLVHELSEAGELTPYGVEYRFPGDLPDVSETEAREACDRADLVQQIVARHLPPTS